jgi:hypothetical protein
LLTELNRYFERAERRAAGTRMRVPPSPGVANYLHHHYHARAVEPLARELTVAGSAWPTWKQTAVLIYLERYPSGSSASALTRFRAQVVNPRLHELVDGILAAWGSSTGTEAP